MGASSAVSVSRASGSAGGSPLTTGAHPRPPVSGLPQYMTVVDAGASAGAAQGRIQALQQSEQTDDRSVAENLADRIGQTDAREAMQAEDARQAAQSDTAQQGQQAAQRSAQLGNEAVSRLQRPEDSVSRADDGSGLVSPGGAPMSRADGPAGQADGAQAGAAGGGGVGGGAGGTSADAATAEGAPADAGGKAAAGAAKPGGAGAADPAGAAAADGPQTQDLPPAPDSAEPDTGAGELGTGDLVLIDVELAEHQRWAAAEHVVGGAYSLQRAEFIAQTAAGGFIGGVASGATMGLGLALVDMAPPQVSGIVHGGLALHGLLKRDWAATGAAIARFGEGSDIYDVLANTLASVSTVIDVVDGVLDTIVGIVTIVEDVAIGVAAGAGVLAFFTFGATAAIAVEAGELASTCEEIRDGIKVVTKALGEINSEVLQPCILLFRALHEFTSDADPREIESGGHDLAGAAGAVGGLLGGWLGGKAAGSIAGRTPPHDGEGTTQRPPHETPPAAGDGPEVHFKQPPAPEQPAGPGRTIAAAEPELPGGATRAAPRMEAEADAALAKPRAGTKPAPDVADIEASQGFNAKDPQTASGAGGGAAEPPSGAGGGNGGKGGGKKGGGKGGGKKSGKGGGKKSGKAAGKKPPKGGGADVDEPAIDPRQGEIAEIFNEAQKKGLKSRGEAELGNLPRKRDRALRAGRPAEPEQPATGDAPARPARRAVPGERDPANHTVPRGVSRSARARARRAAIKDLKEALESGIWTPRAAAALDTLPRDTVIELARNSPRARRSEAERAANKEVEASHVPAVASEPHDAHKGDNVEILSKEDHREGIHDNDTTRSLETARPNPGYKGRPGFHEIDTNQRKPPNPKIKSGPVDPGDITQMKRDMKGDYKKMTPKQQAEVDRWIARQEAEMAGRPVPAKGKAGKPSKAKASKKPAAKAATPDATARTSADTPLKVSDTPTRGTEPLTPQQYEQAAAMAVEMGMPQDQIHAAKGDTSYHPGYDALLIGADLNPLPASQRPADLANPANAALEPRAVIGHEVIGHREAAIGGATRDEVWHEELQASARAALHTPDLSDEQRMLLLQDAAARRRFQTGDGEIYIDTERYGAAAKPKPVAPRGEDDEASVIVDPSLYEAEPGSTPPTPEEPPPSTTPTPTPTGGAPSGDADTHAASPAGGARPGTGVAARAHQAAAYLLPQFFGDDGPSYAEQQKAHRAEFTDDNQPAEGVERVNPHYSEPPGTPDQIVALQNEILDLLAVRARAEEESRYEAGRIDACEDNRAPIAATLADTHGGLGAVRAHEQAVARHEAANQAQQQRQQQSEGLTASYPDKSSGLSVLDLPLAAWEGFTSLASHLPGAAGDRMGEMNAEAHRMREAFGQMGDHMSGADGEQPARAASLADDSARIAATGEQAQSSQEQLQTAADGAAGLQSANDATMAAARQRQQDADQRGDELAAAADDRQAQADSLADQMRAWAQTHHDERAQAIAATAARLRDEGKIVIDSPVE